MARITIYLTVAALIAALTGCFTPFPVQYQLTISSTEGGAVTMPGEGNFTYWAGTTVGLIAEAEEGYCFVDWTGYPCTCSIADVNAASTNITMKNNYSVTANFVEVPVVQYQLAINSTDGGNVTTPGEGVFTYEEGTVVNLVAAADEGYCFLQWTGNVSTVADIYSASTNITINSDYEITGNFGSAYGNYSGILESIITSQGELDIDMKATLVYPEGHGPVEYYADAWPTPEELASFYYRDVEDTVPYPSRTIDLSGVNLALGPLPRDGELEIVNFGSTPAVLTLDGTIYITGDTSIGATGNQLILDLNGQTIFVESSSGTPQNALQVGAKCTIIGSGVIVAIGDIYFAPSGDTGSPEDSMFMLSVSGTTYVQPGGDYYGAIAASISVNIYPGLNPTIIYASGGFAGLNLNFPY